MEGIVMFIRKLEAVIQYSEHAQLDVRSFWRKLTNMKIVYIDLYLSHLNDWTHWEGFFSDVIYLANLCICFGNICDAIKQNESEVEKYDFWFFGIFY